MAKRNLSPFTLLLSITFLNLKNSLKESSVILLANGLKVRFNSTFDDTGPNNLTRLIRLLGSQQSLMDDSWHLAQQEPHNKIYVIDNQFIQISKENLNGVATVTRSEISPSTNLPLSVFAPSTTKAYSNGVSHIILFLLRKIWEI